MSAPRVALLAEPKDLAKTIPHHDRCRKDIVLKQIRMVSTQKH